LVEIQALDPLEIRTARRAKARRLHDAKIGLKNLRAIILILDDGPETCLALG
jgi:hypothetical protein